MTQLTQNPWTYQERQIIAHVVNTALNLRLKASHIVGCMTLNGCCNVVWRVEGKRYEFWFELDWFRAEVQHKRLGLEASQAFSNYGMIVDGASLTQNGSVFTVSRRGTFIGCVGNNSNNWYVVRANGTGRPILAGNVKDAAFSLYMTEVAVVA